MLAPVHLPGTANGTRLLTYYSPASGASAQGTPMKTPDREPPRPPAKITTPTLKEQPLDASLATGQSSERGEDARGEGQITVAAPQIFPHPQPDLSSLPRGGRGDVILDATIDADGHIASLTVTTSLTPAIDEAVMATVRGWIFTPAKKDGVPVPSEQELYFHYERG